MKKFFAFLMSVVLMLSLAVPASATMEGKLIGGTININDAIDGHTYSAYQILYLESYNAETGAYAYKANSAWAVWLATQTDYVAIDDQGYVTWVGDDNAERAAAFAAAAQTQLAGKTADRTSVATGGKATLSDLKLGYYLVDTTLGTLCSLDTTNPTVDMEEKNSLPTIGKRVEEDSNNSWGASNTAQIGDTVNFETTVHAKKGAQNYVVHDQMSGGLTLNQTSIEVKVNGVSLAKENDYNVTFDQTCTDKNNEVATCDFHITFTQTYLDKITADTDIVITYSAILNDDAVISVNANTNDTKLDYSEKSGISTEWAHTDTYTFEFDIIKTDSNKKLLNGAEFELYDAETGGTKIALVKESEGFYRVATAEEKNAEKFTSAVIEAGKVTVQGLDANTTYWLEEIDSPDGYNMLASRVEVKVEDKNLSTTMTGDIWVDGNGGVQITNQAGTELPSTGGMGTTIFYIVGGVMVAAAVILLITKKRMSAEG